MNFQFKHPKFKPKLLIFTIAMLLSISAFSPTIPVQAAGSMTDEDAIGSKDIIGGPNYDRTGFLFWVCDTKGNQISPTVEAITSYGAIVDRNGKLLPASNVDLRNRDGVMASGISTNAPWGPPYKDGAGRGTEIKHYLLEVGAGGHKNAANLIQGTWGEELATQWERREAYLMFEPFYWNQIRANDENTGVWYCTTSYRWGILQGAWPGIPETGDKNIGKYTNQMYPNCLKMEPCQEIIDMGYTEPPHGGRLTNAEMASQKVGWGIGVVWNDNNSIITWDSSNYKDGTPGPAPNTPSGDVSIIKNYRTTNLTTGQQIDDGCYERKEVVNNITIVDEPKYKVIGWKVSDTTTSPIDSISWNPPGTITQQGESTASIKLTGSESCLYLLLERTFEEAPEPMDYNFKITESQITRRVHFSKADVQGTMPKIQDHSFQWYIAAHTTCGGHTYYTDCPGTHQGSHTDSCEEGCTSTHNYDCGTDCVSNTEYCSGWTFSDNTLKLSLNNTTQSNYPNILSTKDGWNKETEYTATGSLTKHYYKDDASFTRTSPIAQTYTSTNWDYVCILMRGSDKLTLAQWQNAGQGINQITQFIHISPNKVLFFYKKIIPIQS